MKLTVETAEKLAQKYIAKAGDYKAFLEAHCKAVYNCVQALAEGKNLDEEVLKIAA